jgi:trk system potassium uptake protein TrkH
MENPNILTVSQFTPAWTFFTFPCMRLKGFFQKHLSTYRMLILGYMLITLIGASLLALPVSSKAGTAQNFLDALFVAVSGISTTGLTVVDIGNYYSTFGQVLLLCIFQIGGIGYMTIIIFIIYVLKRRISLKTQNMAVDSLAGSNTYIIRKFFFFIIVFTFIFEFLGGIGLSLVWLAEYPTMRALFLGFFHSISAFCTAGFGLFSDSLMGYRDNYLVNLIIMALSLAGSIGFIVIYDLAKLIIGKIKKAKPARLSVYSKVVFISTPLVIITAVLIILVSGKWDPAFTLNDRIMAATFQAVSAQTTDGFNTVNIGDMSVPNLIVFMILMFTGAAPGSTAGGIKITTAVVLLCFFWAQMRGTKDNPNLLKREIRDGTIRKALAVFLWFIIIIFIDTLIITGVEKLTLIQVLFEVISAMGNTGLSTGITQSLGPISKCILILTMFIGRVGPLIFVYLLVGKQKEIYYKYPYGEIYVA